VPPSSDHWWAAPCTESHIEKNTFRAFLFFTGKKHFSFFHWKKPFFLFSLDGRKVLQNVAQFQIGQDHLETMAGLPDGK
jgi:hypothetical protein